MGLMTGGVRHRAVLRGSPRVLDLIADDPARVGGAVGHAVTEGGGRIRRGENSPKRNSASSPATATRTRMWSGAWTRSASYGAEHSRPGICTQPDGSGTQGFAPGPREPAGFPCTCAAAPRASRTRGNPAQGRLPTSRVQLPSTDVFSRSATRRVPSNAFAGGRFLPPPGLKAGRPTSTHVIQQPGEGSDMSSATRVDFTPFPTAWAGRQATRAGEPICSKGSCNTATSSSTLEREAGTA